MDETQHYGLDTAETQLVEDPADLGRSTSALKVIKAEETAIAEVAAASSTPPTQDWAMGSTSGSVIGCYGKQAPRSFEEL